MELRSDMDNDELDIHTKVSRDEIKAAPVEVKLNYIIDAVFNTSKSVEETRKTLQGNGKRGLCERVRTQESLMKLVLGALLAVVIAVLTGLVK